MTLARAALRARLGRQVARARCRWQHPSSGHRADEPFLEPTGHGGGPHRGGIMLETLIAAMLIGLIPAVVAKVRGVADGPGLGFVEWWLFGALLFIVALPCACLARPRSGRHAPKHDKTWHDNHPPAT